MRPLTILAVCTVLFGPVGTMLTFLLLPANDTALQQQQQPTRPRRQAPQQQMQLLMEQTNARIQQPLMQQQQPTPQQPQVQQMKTRRHRSSRRPAGVQYCILNPHLHAPVSARWPGS